MPVPALLRIWFVIHFLADILFAIPLFFWPIETLTLFGWVVIDPVATRLVAAALIGIGTTSFLTSHAGKESYHSLLTLKLIWSATAILGFFLSLWQGAPKAAWIFLTMYTLFFCVWVYYKKQL